MGKQRGPDFIEGTYNGRTYYKRGGKYYVRKQSSLSARRVKQTRAFRRTMEYAGWMAAASVIASRIYWKLPEKERKRKRYQALTGEAMRLLRDGMDEVMVRGKLEAAHLQKEATSAIDVKPVVVEVSLKQEVRSTNPATVACDAGASQRDTPSAVTGTALITQEQLAVMDVKQLPPITEHPPLTVCAVSAPGGQRGNSQTKNRSIAIIPAPGATERRPRVLRYKTKRKGGIISQPGIIPQRGHVPGSGATFQRGIAPGNGIAPQGGVTPQKGKTASGNPPVAVPA